MQEFFDIIADLQHGLEKIEALKKVPDQYDGRGIAIAITHLETAMLWLTNAKK